MAETARVFKSSPSAAALHLALTWGLICRSQYGDRLLNLHPAAAQESDWQALCAPLPSEEEGDVTLALDDGTQLTAHSQILQRASSVFMNAMACCSSSSDQQGLTSASQTSMPAHQGAKIRLPLPGTSKAQALLLLQSLYCWARESYLDSLMLTELIDLARVCDQFGVLPVLRLVDDTLVKLCGAGVSPSAEYLTADTAPALFKLARQLHLSRFEVHVAQYLGQNAHAVQLKDLDPTTAAILRGARQLG